MASPAQFTTISTEGGLLPSDLISRLVNDTQSLPGTRDEDYRLTPGRQLREIINRSWNDLLGAWQVFQPQVARSSATDGWSDFPKLSPSAKRTTQSVTTTIMHPFILWAGTCVSIAEPLEWSVQHELPHIR
jgi:hypothetical protein